VTARPAPAGRRTLLAVAASAEARAILRALGVTRAPEPWRAVEVAPGADLVETGVGPACAAGGVARALDPVRHGAVLSAGVAGALPGSGLALGARVVATESVFADLGADTPAGFVDLAQMGFAPAPGVGVEIPADEGLSRTLTPIADRAGPIATVSTCAGTDARAEEIARRTGAIAEAMEGAAVGVAAARVAAQTGSAVPFAELRVVSNTTGDRHRQVWDLDAALAALGELVRDALATRV